MEPGIAQDGVAQDLMRDGSSMCVPLGILSYLSWRLDSVLAQPLSEIQKTAMAVGHVIRGSPRASLGTIFETHDLCEIDSL